MFGSLNDKDNVIYSFFHSRNFIIIKRTNITLKWQRLLFVVAILV